MIGRARTKSRSRFFEPRTGDSIYMRAGRSLRSRAERYIEFVASLPIKNDRNFIFTIVKVLFVLSKCSTYTFHKFICEPNVATDTWMQIYVFQLDVIVKMKFNSDKCIPL